MPQALVTSVRQLDHWVVTWSTRWSRPGAWDMKMRIAVLTLASFIAMC
jgi:hypothetical protein